MSDDVFTLRIETGNAAFDSDGYEVARLLRDVADMLENGFTSGPLHDINGNAVGSWEA